MAIRLIRLYQPFLWYIDDIGQKMLCSGIKKDFFFLKKETKTFS